MGIGVRACIVVGLFVTAMARIKQRSHESRNGGTKTCRLDSSYVALAQLLPLASNLPSLDDGLLAKIIPCLREPSQDDGNAQAWQLTGFWSLLCQLIGFYSKLFCLQIATRAMKLGILNLQAIRNIPVAKR